MELDLFKTAELNGVMGKKALEIIEEGVHKEYGFKAFCFDIQKDERQVRDALNGNHKYFSITWLPFVIAKCPMAAENLINYFCDIAGREHPGPKKEMTTEEELKFLKARIKERDLGSLFSR